MNVRIMNIAVMSRTSIIQLLGFISLLSGIYFSTFSWLIRKDWARDDYSYGILIPFIVLYLIWEKRKQLSAVASHYEWSGFVLILPGIALFWLGELAGEFFMLYMSAWLITVGLFWLHVGLKKLKIILFPIIFSLSMFPLPGFINNKITLKLKILSSQLGVMMMQAYGLSAHREGNIIDLGFTQLQVVDACSGLRYLYPVILLSILIAYFYPLRIWKRVVLVLSSAPLTILSNSLRIALSGILSEKFGPKAVEGFFHDFEGWLIFMFTLAILLMEIFIMNKLFPETKKKAPKNKPRGEKEGQNDAEDTAGHEIASENRLGKEGKDEEQTDKSNPFKKPQFVVSVLLLAVTLVLSQGIEFREAVPMGRPFSKFPETIGQWDGTRQLMEQKFIDTLDLTDYFMADYTDDSGRPVNLYVAYYESQRKGESIHSPATCLRGGGWKFKEAGSSKIELDDGSFMPINKAVIEKEPIRQLSYYWFPSRGRILTNAYQMKFYNFWDALTRQRTDGALVRVITLVDPGESLNEAEKRVESFIREIEPVLSEFLPK